MDNSVYQPLSHALNPPPSTARPAYPTDTHHQNSIEHDADQDAHADPTVRPEEEEEEEEDEVEGAVDHPATTGTSDKQSSANHGHPNSAPTRRKPGRPKGSKNKKPRFDLSGSPPKQQFSAAPAPFYGFPPPPHPTAVPMQPHPPPHPVAVPSYSVADASNQAFYDFQWRVLTLCSEFYNAADELIRSAPQHIIHQCFSLPGNQVDPITILHDARRACDQLLANPSQAVLKQLLLRTGTPPASAGPVITNPGSFVMSLTGSPSQSGGYASPNRYPTTPYYAYATQPHQTGTHPYMAQQQAIRAAWSEEETEKLRHLTEESRMAGSGTENGEIDWDWESSTRGMKRRRDTEPGPGAADGVATITNGNGHPSSANPSAQAVLNAVGAAAAASSGSSSVSPDRPASTSASPVTAPPPPPPAPPGGGNLMHWPMPHVAANTPSPVIASTQGSRSVYYNRDRTSTGSKA
ncbi:hypothetical protein DFH11DRAFT_1839626 [Phellopilus nigrolimitatus]|nr:hypothetical protein DFH11DRAFT_1839626 [Phellopilus nigrolimitatus]